MLSEPSNDDLTEDRSLRLNSGAHEQGQGATSRLDARGGGVARARCSVKCRREPWALSDTTPVRHAATLPMLASRGLRRREAVVRLVRRSSSAVAALPGGGAARFHDYDAAVTECVERRALRAGR